MIYDYRQFIEDYHVKKKRDNEMNAVVGKHRFTYLYKKLEEVFLYSNNELYYLLDHIQNNDTVYVYDMSCLGNNDDEALANIDIILKAGANIIECKQNVDSTNDIYDVNSETHENTGDQTQNVLEVNKNSESIVKDFDYKSSEGYQWIRNKIKEGATPEHILIGFNTLHEFNPEEYSIDGVSQIDDITLSKWIEEIKIALTPTGEIMLPQEWCDRSFAFQWLCDKFDNGQIGTRIIEEFNHNHDEDPKRFSTWKGDYITQPELSKCRQDYFKLKDKERKTQVDLENRQEAFSIIEKEIANAINKLGFKSEQDFYIDYQNNILSVKDNSDAISR